MAVAALLWSNSVFSIAIGLDIGSGTRSSGIIGVGGMAARVRVQSKVHQLQGNSCILLRDLVAKAAFRVRRCKANHRFERARSHWSGLHTRANEEE